MEFYKNYSKQWNEILIKYGDPRTTHWAMMEGFAPTILICISYVILVKKIGPYLMESRKPFQLRGILIVYNSAMVVLSTYLFYEFLASGWWNDYSFVCQPVVKGYSPKALRMTHTCWVFSYRSLSNSSIPYSLSCAKRTIKFRFYTYFTTLQCR
uniref:Predicted protein n=1 Tax=Hordeum vulgare subsp. vulgare TaxID=112509 RepID=F2DK23_HORVV|nr:predicted protein [Hordeum vulgare subsp. vulgare]